MTVFLDLAFGVIFLLILLIFAMILVSFIEYLWDSL